MARTIRHKRYVPIPEPEPEPALEPEPEPKPLFSNSERMFLARLVARVGREAVAEFAMKVPLPRSRGRPALSPQEALEEADNLLWCVEQWTEEARQDGSKHPVTDALQSVCDVTTWSMKTVKEKRRAAVKLIARAKGPV